MKRITALFVLLLTAVLASCGESGAVPAETAASGNQNAAPADGTEAVTEEARLQPELPETDLGGYNFRVLTKGPGDGHWKSKDIYSEAQNGEPINDAVFLRNSVLGEKYNFKVTEIPTSMDTWDVHSDVQKTVMAGEDAYDMAAIGLTYDMSVLAESNCLYNLYDLPHIDLSKPWYDQKANSSLSVGGKLYATTGEMIIMDNEAAYGILFNKEIAAELDLDNFYETVRSGKWTIDKMLDAAKIASTDLNGDGVHDEFDRWGLCGEAPNTIAYIVGMGEVSVKKDGNDIPYFALQNDRYYSAFEKTLGVNGNFDICMYTTKFANKYPDVFADCIDKTFIDGRMLFNCAGLVRVTLFRTMDIDFGIIPMPKYDEAQAEYCSFVDLACANAISVPSSVQNVDAVGLIIEAMSAESMYTLTPAYYDLAVKGKAARDEESLEMLDLIFSNCVYDLGYAYDWGSLVNTISNLMTNKAPNISSTVEKNLPKAEKALAKSLEVLAEAD